MTTTTSPHTTCTGARRRYDPDTLVGQLNAEWDRLTAGDTTATLSRWATLNSALAGMASLNDIEECTSTADAATQDTIFLALLELNRNGDQLAGRVLLQMMLPKAIRIASSYAGYDTRHALEHATITALWETISTYPIERRTSKVAANIALDTLHNVSAEFSHRRKETALEPEAMAIALTSTEQDSGEPSDLELLNLLAWAVERHAITVDEAQLVIDTYAPVPGRNGGKHAASLHGLTWQAARQRTSRTVRKITEALISDGDAPELLTKLPA